MLLPINLDASAQEQGVEIRFEACRGRTCSRALAVMLLLNFLVLLSMLIVTFFMWQVARKGRRTGFRQTFGKYRRFGFGKNVSQDGYVLVGTKFEHRLIAERVLGRKLVPDEVVHHINGRKTDNRLSNLCVLTEDAHHRFHDWLRWKATKEGRYPTKSYQRAKLRYDYKGILLVIYPTDLPPLDSEWERKRGGNAS